MKHILLLCLFFAGLTFSGCENNELLLSEKKLNSEINGTWKIVAPRPSSDFTETWVFSGGSISITSTRNNVNMTALGNYSVDTKLTKAYVNLSGFNFSNPSHLNSGFTAEVLNRKWTLVEINGDVLYISATDNAGAIRSLEFAKQ